MMANSKDFLVRRRNVKRVLQTLSLVCTVFGTDMVSQNAFAHAPNCSCGKGELQYGSADCGTEDGIVSVPVRTRKLSVAEKFLKHLDKVGDQIEANILPIPAVQCTTCGPAPGDFVHVVNHEASCGVEIEEPSCGLESPSRDCGCSSCSGGFKSRETRRPNGNSYRYQNSQEEIYYEEEVYEDSLENAPSESSDVTSKPSVAPKAAPSPRSPSPAKPAPVEPPPAQLDPVPLPQQAVPPKLEMPPSDGFTPRRPNPSPAQLDPVPAGPKQAQPSVEPPVLRLPEVKDPIRIPPPNAPQIPKPQLPTPQTPTPLDNLPDVLMDPFKDDLSFQHRRNRMNGMNANARNAAVEQRAVISQNSSSRGQSNVPVNSPASGRVQSSSAGNRWSEARGNIRSDDQGTVSRASAEQPAIYDGRNDGRNEVERPQGNRSYGQVQRISHEEPLQDQHVAPIVQRPGYEGQPQVRRVPVPRRY